MVSKFKEKFTESYSLVLENDQGIRIKSWSVGLKDMRIDYDVDLPRDMIEVANEIVMAVHNDQGRG